MDDLHTRNQNQQKEFAQSKLSFTSSWLANSFSCKVQFFSTTSFFMSFLPYNKSGIFSGIFQGQQIQYLCCFLIILKGALSSKYSALLENISFSYFLIHIFVPYYVYFKEAINFLTYSQLIFIYIYV